MTWLGDPPRWGWLVIAPLLLVLFGLFFATLAAYHVADQVRAGWGRP